MKSSEANTLKKLEDFGELLSNERKGEALGGFLDKCCRFNVFRVLKLDQHEIRHSNMISWLLDPNEKHGFGIYFLSEFLRRVISKENGCWSIDFNNDELMRSFIIRREVDYKDIEIVSDKAKVVVVVENKWNAGERESTNEKEGQLKTYQKSILGNSRFNDFRKAFVFLTPNGIHPSDENVGIWVTMGYGEIVEILESEEFQKMLAVDDLMEQRIFIEHYLSVLKTRSDIMKYDDEVNQKCLEIYNRNKEVFDLVVRVVNNKKYWEVGKARELVKNAIDEMVNSGNDVISCGDESNGGHPSFFTRRMNELIYPMQDNVTGSWGNANNYYYWFNINDRDGEGKYSAKLCFELGGKGLLDDDIRMQRIKILYHDIKGREYRGGVYHQTYNWGIATKRSYDMQKEEDRVDFKKWAKEAIREALKKESEMISRCGSNLGLGNS